MICSLFNNINIVVVVVVVVVVIILLPRTYLEEEIAKKHVLREVSQLSMCAPFPIFLKSFIIIYKP